MRVKIAECAVRAVGAFVMAIGNQLSAKSPGALSSGTKPNKIQRIFIRTSIFCELEDYWKEKASIKAKACLGKMCLVVEEKQHDGSVVQHTNLSDKRGTSYVSTPEEDARG